MIISILHLSDLHFKIGQNSFLDKITNLTDSIKNKMFNTKTLFILISGDLAYSGKKEEYILVKKMLDIVERNLKSYNNELIIEFIFTPGNHDCDFADDDIRDILIETVIKEPSKCSNQIVSLCTKVQKN